jgi:hypothetical protein
MAIEYAKSALAESIIPVKDVALKSGVTQNLGDLVQIVAGEVDNVAVAGTGAPLVTTSTNLGVSEGNNFEGLGVTPKVGKVRISGNAIYKAPYGTVAAGGGFTKVLPTASLIGATRAIGRATNEGFVVHTDNVASNKVAKIVDFEITNASLNEGNVYFQIIPSALFTS